MAIANIHELCKGYCELAGFEPPELAPDEKGVTSATIRVGGVDVAMQHFADGSADHIFLTAYMGEPEPAYELAAWRVLMDANLHLAAAAAPSFSRHAGMRQALLQWPYALAQANVADFYQRVAALAEVANRWRRGYFLDDPSAAHAWFDARFGHGTATDEECRAARARFDELYRGTCRLAGQPEPTVADGAGTRSFPLQVLNVDMSVVQCAAEDPDTAFVMAFLGPLDAATELADLLSLMDGNFHLRTTHWPARISREGASGTALLQYALALRSATPEQLIVTAHELAGLAQAWRRSLEGSRLTTAAVHDFKTNPGPLTCLHA